jgi:hypothetical protein
VARLWRNYNLSIVLFAIFLVCWVLQTWSGWVEFVAQEAQHGRSAEVVGADGYVWAWLQATMENWTSEYLQLFSFVTFTAFLIHRGSPESKDGNERLERKVDEIRRQLDSMATRSQ